VDIGLQECATDLAHPFGDELFVENSTASKVRQRTIEFGTQLVEHLPVIEQSRIERRRAAPPSWSGSSRRAREYE
jgi:hypothetical protein